MSYTLDGDHDFRDPELTKDLQSLVSENAWKLMNSENIDDINIGWELESKNLNNLQKVVLAEYIMKKHISWKSIYELIGSKAGEFWDTFNFIMK